MDIQNTGFTLDLIKQFLTNLAEKSDCVYWLSSADLKEVVYISSAYEKIWGRDRDSLYSNPELWITYLHPDDAKKYHPIHVMAKRISELNKDARYEESYRIVRPNGEIRWIIDRGFPVIDQNGHCIGVTGIAIDISSEKISENKILQSKEQTETVNAEMEGFISELLKQLPSYVFWKDKDGVYLGCNELFARSLGLSNTTDVIGKTDYDLPIREEDSVAFRADDQEVIRTEQPKLNIEEYQTFPNGRQVVLLTNKVPLRNKQGRIIGVLGIYSDITERKKMEEELQIAKEKAEAANRVKTEFIQNMQHDIRTPASGIVGGMDILLHDLRKLNHTTNTPKSRELIELAVLISNAASQLHEFLNDVIDFDNADYLSRPIQDKKFDLRHTMQDVIDLEMLAAKAKGVKLSMKVDANAPTIVKGDEYRLKRILLNLTGNAVKFTMVGHVEIGVKLQSSSSNKMLLTFTVTDTGIGMPEDKLTAIFEKFIRLNPSNQGIYKGSGLGLFRVKQFVDALGGEIEVESQLGKGSTFYVTVPFDKPLVDNLLATRFQKEVDTFTASPSEPIIEEKNIEPVNEDEPSVKKYNKHILFIEDTEVAIRVASFLLAPMVTGFTIATTMAQALTALNETKFDLVVSDIGLPDGTGMDIINKVKGNKNSLNYETPFVALTAHTDAEKLEKIKQCQFKEIYSKPLTVKSVDIILQEFNATNSVNNTIIDLEKTAAALYNNDVKLAKELLHSFEDFLRTGIPKMKQDCKDNNIKSVRYFLRELTGSGLAYCKAPRLDKIARELYTHVKNTEDLQKEPKLFADFYAEVDAFLDEMRNLD